MLNFLKNLLSPTQAKRPSEASPVDSQMPATSAPGPKKRSAGYRASVLETHGFELPASDYEKNVLGRKYEREGELAKAIACYEGCVNNQDDGSFVYNRLAIIYRKLKRKDDEVRILKKAILLYSRHPTVSEQSSTAGKLKSFEERLSKLMDT